LTGILEGQGDPGRIIQPIPRVIRHQESLRIPMTNIILIGMPGAGKSTVGVILAKAGTKPDQQKTCWRT